MRNLVPYLLKNRNVIDEHHFWLNTNNPEDICFIESLQREYPAFFKINRKETFNKHSLFDSIWQYWVDYTDEDTIYIRFDDDICFIAPGAVEELIRFRMSHPEPLLVFGNIINNAICSHLLQKKGVIPDGWGKVSYDCMDRNGWKNPRFAELVHRKFLSDFRKGRLDDWKTEDWTIEDCRRFSINVISWFGKDLKPVDEVRIRDLKNSGVINNFTGEPVEGEEPFISQVLPGRFSRPCMICGKAVFAHFAFYTQRPYLEGATNLLECYRLIASARSGLRERLGADLVGAFKKITYPLRIFVTRCISLILHSRTQWRLKRKHFKSFSRNTNTRTKTFIMIKFPSLYSVLRRIKRSLLRPGQEG